MIQTAGSLAVILAILLPVAACGIGAFWQAMDAHAEFYRYEQSHHDQDKDQ